MKIGQIITIHPFSRHITVNGKAEVKKIGRKWITLYDSMTDKTFRVTRFSIMEFWNENNYKRQN